MALLRTLASATQPLFGTSSYDAKTGIKHRFTWKRILLKSAGAVALLSIFSIAAAGQPGGTQHNAQAHSAGAVQLKPTTAAPDDTSKGGADMDTTGTSNSSSNSNSTSISVTVNGQEVSVPENGTSEQTVTSPDGGSTAVNMSHNSDTNGTSFSSSFTSQNSNNFQSNVDTNFSTEQRFGSP